MQTLSIIGGGKVGQTLAKLWHNARVFSVGYILNKNLNRAQVAQQFIGAGRVAENVAALKASDIWLITTPDDAISDACCQLADAGLLRQGDVVLHCSGALTSASLQAAKNAQAWVGSLHPIKSFVSAPAAVASFAGTFCSFEGDAKVADIFAPAIAAINGHFMYLTAADKALYHAGTSIVCNYLCTLMDMGLKALVTAGVDQALASQAIAPIVRETLENILARGSVGALTGPIARGDINTLRKQSAAMHAHLPQQADVFNALGLLTTHLAELKGSATPQQLQTMRDFFTQR